MSIGIIGKKVGMTRIYDAAGKLTPVTVIAAENNTLLQRKTVETDGYNALQVGYHTQLKQRVTKAADGSLREGRQRAEEGSARVPPERMARLTAT